MIKKKQSKEINHDVSKFHFAQRDRSTIAVLFYNIYVNSYRHTISGRKSLKKKSQKKKGDHSQVMLFTI